MRNLGTGLFGTLLVAGAALTAACSSDTADHDGPEEQAAPGARPRTREQIALSVAACPDCEVLAVAQPSFAETGASAYSAKLLDRRSGQYLSVGFTPDGRRVDVDALLAAEAVAQRARYGALTPRLADRASSVAPETTLRTWFWAEVATEYPPKEDEEATRRFELEHAAKVESATHALAEELRARGIKVISEGGGTPLVEAEVPARKVLALKDLPGLRVAGEIETPSLGATVWPQAMKLSNGSKTGAGSRVCILESGYPDDYSQLSGITQYASATKTPVDSHARFVTGLIRSTAANSLQVAHGAEIVICGYSGSLPSGYAHCENWCSGVGSNVIQMSSGFGYTAGQQLNPSDMQFDYLAKRWPYPTEVVISHNEGSVVRNRGYNEIIVGASDDRGTSTVNDDTIAGFSNWINPPSPRNDRELPHLVAPGTDISAVGLTGSGTSLAAPLVSGVVAAMQGIDSRFKSWPEMSRAAILATAVHHVDGGRLTRLPTTSTPGSAADRKDGVGLLHMRYATSLASTGYWTTPASPGTWLGRHAKTITPASFGSDNRGLDVWNIRTVTSGRVRVVITWDSSVTCNASGTDCTSDTPDADLDLEVRDAAGAVVCTSSSYDNTHEVCDFEASSSGLSYTARATKYNFPAPNTYFSIAWFNYNPSLDDL